MRLINTVDAIGHVLCHDMTQIIPGVVKDARFRKGHVVKAEDIPVLLSMGKERLYVFESQPGMLHEDEAALRLLALCQGPHMQPSEAKEGKIELSARVDGLFEVDTERLLAVNLCDETMIATRHSGAVKTGDKLAGMRVIPLVIHEDKLARAEQAAGEKPLMCLIPFALKTASLIVTGSEVASGLIEDKFSPVVIDKLKAFGISVIHHATCSDDPEEIVAAIAHARQMKVDMIVCTGGMSVDPDDRTPGAIRQSGANIISYGAPTLPGAMLLLGYYPEGTPVMGLPGCVMYAKATIFDILLPYVAAAVPVTKRQIAALGHGGLCLKCEVCHYPICPFGKA